MSKDEAIEILSDMRAEYNIFGAENEATKYHALSWAIQAMKAEPVTHGRWLWDNRLGEWYCSECNRIMKPYVVEKGEGEYEMAQPNYCGWCGADMREVEE